MQRIVLVLCLAVMACQARRSNLQEPQVQTEMVEACAEGFVGIAGLCYHFNQNKLSWADARTMCQAQEARLASVLTTDQYNGLLSHINANYPGTYWTSGKFQNGGWVWTSSEQTVSPRWWGVQPRTTTNQCVYFCSFTHKYWSKSCSNHVRFICEKQMEMVIKEVPAV